MAKGWHYMDEMDLYCRWYWTRYIAESRESDIRVNTKQERPMEENCMHTVVRDMTQSTRVGERMKTRQLESLA